MYLMLGLGGVFKSLRCVQVRLLSDESCNSQNFVRKALAASRSALLNEPLRIVESQNRPFVRPSRLLSTVLYIPSTPCKCTVFRTIVHIKLLTFWWDADPSACDQCDPQGAVLSPQP